MKLTCTRLAILAICAAASYGNAVAAEPPVGAAACSGCHAASGARVDTAIPPIAGRAAAEIEQQMQAFKAGQRPATVMDRIAKGFSDAEVQAIAAWYASLKP